MALAHQAAGRGGGGPITSLTIGSGAFTPISNPREEGGV